MHTISLTSDYKESSHRKFYLFSNRAIGGEVTSDGDFLIFEGNRYSSKGFLFKSFVMSAIVSVSFRCFFAAVQFGKVRKGVVKPSVI